MSEHPNKLRRCLSEPIPQVWDAVRYLDAAVSAHMQQKLELAAVLFQQADMPEIRLWTKSIWANSKIHLKYPAGNEAVPKALRSKSRMPVEALKTLIHERDGYTCRFCSMPVVRSTTRMRIQRSYPEAVSWGGKEISQHAAFQAMWAQYDHIVPHAHGGINDLENLVLTCAPCNFGRAGYTLAEVGVSDPRSRSRQPTRWDGLIRFP